MSNILVLLNYYVLIVKKNLRLAWIPGLLKFVIRKATMAGYKSKILSLVKWAQCFDIYYPSIHRLLMFLLLIEKESYASKFKVTIRIIQNFELQGCCYNCKELKSPKPFQ